MDAMETIERDGYVGEIHVDAYAESPRDMRDCASILAQLSDRFAQIDGYDEADRLREAWNRFGDERAVSIYARTFLDAVAVEFWDDPRSPSRIVGIVRRQEVESLGLPDPLAALVAEIGEYAAWTQGDVYGYTVHAPDGEGIDSCWGYYGDDELPYVRECISDAIESHRAGVHAERVALYKTLVG